MSTQLKETSQPLVMAEQPARETPAYSSIFLSAMLDTAYNTLHDYLVAQGIKPEAEELLDQLVLLQSIQRMGEKETQILYIFNQEASEAIASMSKTIPMLGGGFYTQFGMLLKA